MLFLSHANPEDNEFALWLALQLAKEGYPVWCDLTKLLGGEDFWKDIEEAIRVRTAKFLYVLSRTSNTKIGPLQELQVAQNVAKDNKLQDFIIPLLIDDLTPRQINIQLARINAVSFNHGWAKGLNTLLDKLMQDNIPKDDKFTPISIVSWWRQQFSANKGISSQPEEYLSNWFPILSLPPNIYFHILHSSQIKRNELQHDFPYPAFQHEHFLVSFGKADDFALNKQSYISIIDSYSHTTLDFLEGNISKMRIDRKHARNFVSRLLRMGWEKMIESRGLPTYEFANDKRCLYFVKDFIENDKVSFKRVNGERTFRQMVGYKSIKAKPDQSISKRFWHFGIQAKPLLYPTFVYLIKPHVLFSDDGNKVWESKTRLHKARRSQCKNWWNPDWRDRIIAAMAWLSNEKDYIEIQLASDVAIQASNHPLTFVSPVSYMDPEKSAVAITNDKEQMDYYDEFEELEGDEE
jgi:hypothetical protein